MTSSKVFSIFPRINSDYFIFYSFMYLFLNIGISFFFLNFKLEIINDQQEQNSYIQIDIYQNSFFCYFYFELIVYQLYNKQLFFCKLALMKEIFGENKNNCYRIVNRILHFYKKNLYLQRRSV